MHFSLFNAIVGWFTYSVAVYSVLLIRFSFWVIIFIVCRMNITAKMLLCTAVSQCARLSTVHCNMKSRVILFSIKQDYFCVFVVFGTYRRLTCTPKDLIFFNNFDTEPVLCIWYSLIDRLLDQIKHQVLCQCFQSLDSECCMVLHVHVQCHVIVTQTTVLLL